jgi:hypothetical protein
MTRPACITKYPKNMQMKNMKYKPSWNFKLQGSHFCELCRLILTNVSGTCILIFLNFNQLFFVGWGGGEGR